MKLPILMILLLLIATELLAVPQISIVGPNEATFPQTLVKAVAKKRGYQIHYPYSDLKQGEVQFQRLLAETQSGELDLFWSMTNAELESQFEAIKIPVFRGLFGFRIPLVRQYQDNLFKHISSLEQLSDYSSGSGTYWPDTEIIEANNVPVVKTLKYKNLFAMLEGGRFDYFPRGLNEPWHEITAFSELNLTVEKNIMFQYVSPVYFFVKKNAKLASILRETLNEMVASGEFNALFFADPDVANALTKSNVSKRRTFHLHNPHLPEGTPIERKELWFDPKHDLQTSETHY